MKSPTTRQENLKLVGRLVWIRQFLETRLYEEVKSSTFAELMKPIHHLNKSSVPFEWTQEAEEAFLKIKKKLTSSPIISGLQSALQSHNRCFRSSLWRYLDARNSLWKEEDCGGGFEDIFTDRTELKSGN